MKKNQSIWQSQSAYLNDLLSKHKESRDCINQFIAQMNSDYQKKIEEGEYVITKKIYSKSTSNLHYELKDIKQYRTQKQLLQSRLKSLGKCIKEEKGGSVLSDQQRLIFLKKIKKQQLQLNKKRQQSLKLKQVLQKQKYQQQKMLKQLEFHHKRQTKRKQIERRLYELEQQKERRAQQIKERNRQYQEIAKEKILLDKIQQNYNQIQNATLQLKKKKLAEIRQIHKPMSKSEFQQHLSKIHQFKDMNQKRLSLQLKQKNTISTQKFYKSHWYKGIINQQKIDEQKQHQNHKQALKQLKDKQKKYSQYIKHNYAPETDQKLIEEMQKRFPTPIKRKKAKEIRQMGLNNLKTSKEKIMTKQKIQLKKIQQNKNDIPINNKPKDYLQQLRKEKRSISLTETHFEPVSNRSGSIQLDDIKNYTDRLQKQAHQKQQLQKIKKSVVDAQVDELYMKALNAKLNILSKK